MCFFLSFFYTTLPTKFVKLPQIPPKICVPTSRTYPTPGKTFSKRFKDRTFYQRVIILVAPRDPVLPPLWRSLDQWHNLGLRNSLELPGGVMDTLGTLLDPKLAENNLNWINMGFRVGFFYQFFLGASKLTCVCVCVKIFGIRIAMTRVQRNVPRRRHKRCFARSRVRDLRGTPVPWTQKSSVNKLLSQHDMR